MQITEIITDETLRELRMHGSPKFPFEYYYDEIHKYDKHVIEWHWHNEIEWIYVESGIVECFIGSEQIRLTKGCGLFINSKAIHRFESKKGAFMPNILFLPEFISPRHTVVYHKYLLPIIESDCLYVMLQNTRTQEKHLLNQLCHIFTLVNSPRSEKELDIQISVITLWRDFYVCCRNQFLCRKTNKNMLLQSRMQIMMQYIDTNYKNKITLEEISKSANISQSEALRCFHISIQSTPIKYLIDYRLNRAKDLLLTTDSTITQIAVEVGIENISYFVRIFTKKFGTTPKKFRLQQRSL